MSFVQIKNIILILTLIVLAISTILSFVRTVIGPRISDRIVGVNMIGTRVIIMIAVLASYLQEYGLFDVDLIYVMLSFLAVIVLCKIYIVDFAQHGSMNARKGEKK
ncbi:MAG: monovalent cation/H+ antiporter complex subunit F [Eubacteriales bacterium]|nr:monovalent cation/H+ antiporter complex subunit F [Eubacteriales bacterium]